MISFYMKFFLNSIKIKKTESNSFKLIKFDNLHCKVVYEKIILNNEFFVMLDTLKLKKNLFK